MTTKTKKKSKTKVKLPPATAFEQEAERKALQFAEQRIQAVAGQAQFQAEQFAALGPQIEAQEANAARARAESDRLAPLRAELQQIQLDRLRAGPGGVGEPIDLGGPIETGGPIDLGGAIDLGGPIPLEATPEQIRLIDEAIDAQIALGGSDIETATRRGLELLREELAPSLGLRSTDTPILDRGGRVVEEGLRQFSQLSRDARATGAEQRLNFPLQAAERTLAERGLGLTSELGQRGLNLGAELGQRGQQLEAELGARSLNLQSGLGAQGLRLGAQQLQIQDAAQQALAEEEKRRFNEALAQSAFQNRLNLRAQTGTLGLGLAEITTGLPAALRGAEFIRATQQTVKTKGSATPSTLGAIGQGFDVVGKGLNLVGQVGKGIQSLSTFSSVASKEDIRDIDEDRTLAKIARLPVTAWRYKGDSETHIGPMAEDFQREFGLGDGKTIDLRDTIGLTLVALKALIKRMDKLEAGPSLGLRAT